MFSKDIKYIGVNDHKIDLFEGQYPVKNGMSYNSYVIIDEKVAVLDTVDVNFTHEWLDNLENALNGRKVDYLIIHHMEPDHSANIVNFLKVYPEAVLVASDKAFKMMANFFNEDFSKNAIVVKEGSVLSLGEHELHFIAAPMVHWPEVMVSYEAKEKVLFSADGFGKFGALDKEEEWACEARRYYFGIVGKYGAQVQALLKKASSLDIHVIAPLHGPILDNNLSYYLNLYNIWSSYQSESEGIAIFYTSVYGNTKKAILLLEEQLKNNGCPKVVIHDLARTDMSEALEDAFRYNKLVLATTTYNTSIFPFMNTFIHSLIEHGLQSKTIGLIENGSWAPLAAKVMSDLLSACKNLTILEPKVRIMSSLNNESKEQLALLTSELTKDYLAKQDKTANKNDLSALFNIGYGLYVVTSSDGNKDNGLIVNTVSQVTNCPNRIAVTINKDNYSHHVIKGTKKMNLNCLSIDAPFDIFKRFGFQSGRTTDKFLGMETLHSDNGLAFLTRYINSFISLVVDDYVDLGTHGMFICSISESRVINNVPTMTYDYYQNNVKPKAPLNDKKGYVCRVCGYVFEGENVPDDFVCPLCKHGASDFEPIKD